MGSLYVGKPAPDFVAQAVVGKEVVNISLKDFRGKYVILFFYPKDFTYVCPTELHAFQEALGEFQSKGAEVLGCSVDDLDSHSRWLHTDRKSGGIAGVTYPLISDVSYEVSRLYGVFDEQSQLSFRGTFLIDKGGIVRHVVVNDLPLGRSIDEEKRVLDALIFFENHGLVCPANWQQGQKAMAPNDDGLKEYFGTID